MKETSRKEIVLIWCKEEVRDFKENKHDFHLVFTHTHTHKFFFLFRLLCLRVVELFSNAIFLNYVF